MSHVAYDSGTFASTMRQYSRLWLASILLSSIVTGGGSFLLLSWLTDLSYTIVIAVSAGLVIAGDVALAFLMQAVSPTRITLGPGDRRHDAEQPPELGMVATRFSDRAGHVSVRGETWKARQAIDCRGRLEAGETVRIVERDGLTLIVAATN